MTDSDLLSVPAIRFGPDSAMGLVSAIHDVIETSEEPRRALLVIDPYLLAQGVGGTLLQLTENAGIDCEVFSEFEGEPDIQSVHAASALARSINASVVIAIGGGSALDIGKSAACVAAADHPVAYYLDNAHPLPEQPLAKIAIPTTAGTGSESSATNIITDDDGHKHWLWGPQSKPDIIILDPLLTVSVPPHLTAWTGLDAFVHAFEACTNKNANDDASVFCHRALALISQNLITAINYPEDIEARGQMQMAATLAGIGIDRCGTAIAHNMSHALASLAPIHHGLATALAFELTLSWLVEAETEELQAAATACGVDHHQGLPDWISAFMTDCHIERQLPPEFATVSASQLAEHMRALPNAPMRDATIRQVTDADIEHFATQMIALA